MRIDIFREKIETYPQKYMNFCIEDVFSWRGVYNEPCCSLSTKRVPKQHNLEQLDRLVTETFNGWKGGEYRYDDCDDLHFESGESEWSDGDYIIHFIVNNFNDEIKHIFG